eukprot:169346-Chlamydomonas_euryale.AAC.2
MVGSGERGGPRGQPQICFQAHVPALIVQCASRTVGLPAAKMPDNATIASAPRTNRRGDVGTKWGHGKTGGRTKHSKLNFAETTHEVRTAVASLAIQNTYIDHTSHTAHFYVHFRPHSPLSRHWQDAMRPTKMCLQSRCCEILRVILAVLYFTFGGLPASTTHQVAPFPIQIKKRGS